MERAVELFAAISFLIIGLSHLLQPVAWREYFLWLHGKGRAGMFIEGFLLLNFGAFIAAFHNVWSGGGMVLTLVGWAQVLKGMVRFLAPGFSLRVYERLANRGVWQLRAGGVLALGIGVFLIYNLLR